MGLKKFLKEHGIEVVETSRGLILRDIPPMAVPVPKRKGKKIPPQVLHYGAKKGGLFDGVPEAFPGDGVPTGTFCGTQIDYINWDFEKTPEEDSVAPPVKRGLLIGLGGLLRHGKDAVADILVEEYGFQKYGMSDPLNEALLVLNPIVSTSITYRQSDPSVVVRHYKDLHDEVGYVEAKKNPEVRRLLQMLGTDVGRKMIDPDIWVKIARERIEKDLSEGKNVAITAIRFPNELDMVKDLGGELVWVQRPGKEFEPSKDAHASETSVRQDQFPVGVVNNGTLEQLATAVEYVFSFIQEGGTPKGYIGGNDYIYSAVPSHGFVTVKDGHPVQIENGKVTMTVNPGSPLHGLIEKQFRESKANALRFRN